MQLQRLNPAEFFTQKRAAERAARIPAETKDETRQQLRLARQRHEAAESLWASGHPAEAIRLLVDSAQRTLDAVAALPPEEQDASRPAIDALKRHVEISPLPRLDADVSTQHAEQWRELLRARGDVDADVFPVLASAKEIQRSRIVRIAVTVGLVVVTVIGLILALRTEPKVGATASGWLGRRPQFEPAKAIDGDRSTEWLLEDRTNGWIEVTLDPPRDITAVKLLNAHNPPYEDRGTQAFRIELFSGSRSVGTANGRLPPQPPPPREPHRVAVRGSNVDRVRFSSISYYRIGGGLAEIEFE